MKIKLVIMILILQLLSYLSVKADEIDNLLTLSLEELMKVTVTVASKTDKTLRHSPASISLITQTDIRRLGIKTVEQLLNYIPGMNVTRDHLSGSSYPIGVRGRRSNAYTNEVLILLDGIRLNDEYNGGALQFDRLLTVDNIKQVEIIRGPGSAIYGSNAVTAVINIKTLDEDRSLKVEMGEDGQQYLNFNQTVENSLGTTFVTLNVNDQGTQSYVAPNSGTTRDPQKNHRLYLKHQSDSWHFNLYQSNFEVNEFWLFGFENSDVNNYKSKLSLASFSKVLSRTSNLELELEFNYRRSKARGLIEIVPAEGMAGLNAVGITEGVEAFLGGPVQEQKWNEVKLFGQYAFKPKHQILGGIEYRQDNQTNMVNQNNYELNDFINVLVLGQPGTIAYYGDVIETANFSGGNRDIYALYLQDEYQWDNGLTSTLGFRYDHYSDFGSNLSPRLAFVYDVNENHGLKLLYGEAFKAPPMAQLYLTGSPIEKGNLNLKPELNETAELIWHYHKENHYFSLSYYYTDISQTIINAVLPGDPRLTFVNKGTDHVSGFEIEYQLNLNDYWDMKLTASSARERITEPYDAYPENSFSAVINYHNESWNVNLNTIYRSSTERNLLVIEDSYWLTNLSLRYQLNNDISLTFKVENLTDTEIQYPSNAGDPLGVYNRGRAAFVGIEWQL